MAIPVGRALGEDCEAQCLEAMQAACYEAGSLQPSAYSAQRPINPAFVCASMERLNCAIGSDAQRASAGKLARRNFDATAQTIGRER